MYTPRSVWPVTISSAPSARDDQRRNGEHGARFSCWQIVANAGFPDDKLVRSGVAEAPGHGSETARTRLCRVCAGSSQSSRPSSGVRRPIGCGCDPADAHRWCRDRRQRPAQQLSGGGARLRCSVRAASSAPIATACWATISPASARFTIRCRVTPVSLSPLTSTQFSGARPRYFGSSEPCRLNAPFGARLRISSPSRLR